MDDSEEAFLNSMKARHEAEEAFGPTNGNSAELSDSNSSDEYDPDTAVPTAPSPSAAQDLAFQSNPYDPLIEAPPSREQPKGNGLPDLLNTLPGVTANAEQATLPPNGTSATDGPVDLGVDGASDLLPTIDDTPRQEPHLDQDAVPTDGDGDDVTMQISARPSAEKSPQTISADEFRPDISHIESTLSDALQNDVSPLVPNAATIDDAANAPSTDDTAKTAATNNFSQLTPDSAVHNLTPRARLPHDRVGILEDRIKEDPRGDVDAWVSLVDEHKKRGKLSEARSTYDRMLQVFPSAADQWVAYAHMENEAQNRHAMEQIFQKTLMQLPNLQLWSTYLDHIRRIHNVQTDTSGTARQTIHQASDLALQQVGIDKDAGRLWQDYIQFIKSGPGIIGGSNWQDQQKMDLLRKTYQRAICIPTSATSVLWKEYDVFEMGLNKVTGRKFLQDQSAGYMSARSSYQELQNITRNLRRTTLPSLPPIQGFEGDEEYIEQLDIWTRWIQWEKDDPLVLKQDEPKAYRDRVIFVYKQALMAMRFWPSLWCEAADFSFSNDLEAEGNEFLVQGATANPESCLLAFKRADRLEITSINEEGDESAKRRGATVREPYDKVLDALYDLITKAKERETREVAHIEAEFAAAAASLPANSTGDREEEINEDTVEKASKTKEGQINAVKMNNGLQMRILSKTISFAWIALMRAMRRIQGKGKPNEAIGGSRQIFTDARKRGRITSDVYVASALIEYHCYDVEAGRKIFERGLKLFPEDEFFALEYVKHLVAVNDHTNARVVFETTVNKLGQKPETALKAKPLYAFFHDFECQYGELTQITKLEKRMGDLFPDDPTLTHFSRRFVNQGFDPTTVRPVISPSTQARPKIYPLIETSNANVQSPPDRPIGTINSPKRPLPTEESDNEANRPRKIPRGESPLKGAAGRRQAEQKRSRQAQETPHSDNHAPIYAPTPPILPRTVLFLLGIIPGAHKYQATKFKPEEMVRLMRETTIPATATHLRPPGVLGPPATQQPQHYQQPPQIHQMHQFQQMPPAQYPVPYYPQ